MTATTSELHFQRIEGGGSLDPIEVYWRDIEQGKGSVTITCYGCAWTAYFGAMGENHTIRSFFLMADVGYLVTKLGITPLLKCRQRDDEYLSRIVRAIKKALVEEVPR